MTPNRTDLRRRTFLTVLAGSAAATAASGVRVAPQAAARAAVPAVAAAGYRLTAHVKKFYRSASGY